MKKLLLSALIFTTGFALAQPAHLPAPESKKPEFTGLSLPSLPHNIADETAKDINQHVIAQLKKQSLKYRKASLLAYRNKRPVNAIQKAHQSE